MERTAYDKRSFRNLPRERCVVADLFGPSVGECAGYIHRHHVDPSDPDSRTLEVCNSHHQRLHTALRALEAPERDWKRCTHFHPYPEGKAACERRLNGLSSAA
jgi:hypothetical protein